MAKKKLTIKYYANTKLKPQTRGKKELYPIYAQLTYDRKTTNFKVVDWDEDPIWSTENADAESVYKSERSTRNIYHLEKITQFDQDVLGDRFEVKGLSGRIQHIYNQPLVDNIGGTKSMVKFLIDNSTEEENVWGNLEDTNPFMVYHIAKFFKPDIQDSISPQVFNRLIAESLIWIMARGNYGEYWGAEFFTFKWIEGKLKKRFMDFFVNFNISSLPDIQQKQISMIFDDFELITNELEKYADVITNCIKEKVLWMG